MRKTEDWNHWIEKAMLIIGVTLLLSGIIFFFAYNWSEMSKFEKFILVQAGIIGTFAMAAIKGNKVASGQAYLFSASILTGVLLAIFGQTYQTGADAYTLFLAWSALILGWLITGKNPAIWCLWIILLNITFVTWYEQVIGSSSPNAESISTILFLLINIISLSIREYLIKKNHNWLENKATRWLSVILLVVPSTWFLLEVTTMNSSYLKNANLWLIVASALCSLVVTGILITYRYILPELFSLFLPVVSISILTLAVIARLFFENASRVLIMFAYSPMTLVIAGIAIFYLQSAMKAINVMKAINAINAIQKDTKQ